MPFRTLAAKVRFPKLCPLLGGVALLLVLILAARQRFSLPQTPQADPDTWGYLHPALSKLTGNDFQHTYGRSFIYPGFLYLILWLTGDFRAIAVAQHLLGLAGGILLWCCWCRWYQNIRAPRLPRFAGCAIGVLMAACYLLCPSAVQFEQELRPESIFPFFAILNIYLALEWIRHRKEGFRSTAAWWLGAASLFNSALLYFIKPSFGLTLGFAVLPVAIVVINPGQPAWRKILLFAAPGLAAVLLLWLPEHLLARTDPTSQVFLPETLLTVHADVIRDQMFEDVVNNESQPYSADWLTEVYLSLQHEIRIASRPEQTPYQSLGFNPDYLMYDNSICRQLIGERGVDGISSFGQHYFLRAWEKRPVRMMANVWRQMHIFYASSCPAYRLIDDLQLSRGYELSVKSFDDARYQAGMQLYSPARDYLAHCRELASASTSVMSSRFMASVNRFAARSYLAVLLAVLAAGIAVVLVPALRERFAVAAALLAYFYSYNFATCLTVSIIHSLDVGRYSVNQLIFTLLPQVTGVAFVLETLSASVALYGGERLSQLTHWLLRSARALGTKRTGISVVVAIALNCMTVSCSREKYYTQGEPTDEEQAALEALNRARISPRDESQRLAGVPGVDEAFRAVLASSPSRPPVAFNAEALHAQRRYVLQVAMGMMGDGPPGAAQSPPPERPSASDWLTHGETWERLSFSAMLAAYRLSTPTSSSGQDIAPGEEREIGIGILRCQRFGAPGVGEWLAAGASTSSPWKRRLLLGVVYHDNNGNGWYDPGEGVGSVEVHVSGASFYTRTSRSGGYAIPLDGLPQDAQADVHFRLSADEEIVRRVAPAATNTKLDIVLPSLPPASLLGALSDVQEVLMVRAGGNGAGRKHKLKGTLTLKNQGGIASPAVNVKLYVSPLDHLDENQGPPAQYLSTVEAAAVAPGESVTRNIRIPLGEDMPPRLTGYRVFAWIDPENRSLAPAKTTKVVATGPLP